MRRGGLLWAAAFLSVLSTAALGHAGGFDIVTETDGYLVELGLEDEFVFAGQEALITVRLEDAETLDQVGVDRAHVRIRDEAGRLIVSGTFAEDPFYVGTVQFAVYLPEPGTYTAEIRFEEGRGETLNILAEAEDISFVVFPQPDGEQTARTRTAALLIAVAAIVFFSYRAFRAKRE